MYRPMLAVDGGEPFDDAGWLFEPKWDGYRAIVCRSGGSLSIHGRHRNLTPWFPELQALPLAPGAVVDGEIVAFVAGRPDFRAIRRRSRGNVCLVAFDLLELEGKPLLSLPLRDRRALLFDHLTPSSHLMLSRGVVGEGRRFFAGIQSLGHEGMMAKLLTSSYLPGRRSSYWRKFVVLHEATVEITAVEESRDHRWLAHMWHSGSFRGRLLLPSVRIDPSLLASVRVEQLSDRYVFHPPLCARVRYRELTPHGFFRHPVFLGFVP